MKLFGKIGRRLLAWFLVVALIPLLFMGYQGYYFAREAVQREVFLHMESVAESRRRAIDQWVRERLADLRVLATHRALSAACAAHVAGDPQALTRAVAALNDWHVQHSDYTCLCLYNADGQPLVCTTGDSAHIAPHFYRTDLYRHAISSPQPVTGPVFLQQGIGPSMYLAAAVRDANGKATAVVTATLTLAQTLNPIILDTTGLGRSGQAYLVDTDKVMLTPSRFMHHPDPLTHTMDTEGIRRALAGTSGAGVYTGFEGQQVLGAWTYLPVQQWALIAEMDAAEAFAPLARLRHNALIVAALTLGTIMLVVAFLARSLSRPIHELAAASLDVSRGNLERTVTVRLRDELGELAGRFNDMVRSLRESRRSLQEAYDELLRAQRRIVQAERLAAIGELVASVVHEIRNPLSAVKMNLRILESKCAQDAIAAEHFQLARTQTERLEKMLADLLDYSKPLTLTREEVNPGAFVSEVVRSFERNIPPSSVTVHLSIGGNLPPLLLDRERLAQALWNVLLNAQQACGEQGEIRIEVDTVVHDGADAVSITVSDNGHGIAPEHLPHIFEPFFTTRKRGTGLGLANAHKIVAAHGGQMLAESTLHKGTVMRIILPLER